MASQQYTGKVFWQNGAPVAGVEVRIYEPGTGQSPLGPELTVAPGHSQADGSFAVQTQPSSFIDDTVVTNLEPLSHLFDTVDTLGQSLGLEPRPQIQFGYSVKGRSVSDLRPFRKLHRGYRLSRNPPVDFKPSKDGFVFQNQFKAFELPITIAKWIETSRIPDTYGLCGGMSAAAYDFCLAHLGNPESPDIRQYRAVPNSGTVLHRYLLRRTMDSFGPAGLMIVKTGDWSLLPSRGPAGTCKLTLDEFKAIRQRLDEGQCVCLALIYEHASNLIELATKIWLNHQVLAYGYAETGPGKFEIAIYDSNYPDQDAVLIAQRQPVGEVNDPPVDGLVTKEFVPGRLDKEVRGFFDMPYQPASPPGKSRGQRRTSR